MKKILITFFPLITLGLLAHPASATVISFTSASASNASASDFNPSGYSSSSDAIYDATNFAKAKTSGSAIGVEARSSNGETSRARASWSDVWGSTIAVVGPPFNPVLGFKYHLDGVIDPLFLNPSSAEDVYMDIGFSYEFGSDQHFFFSACYDAGPCGLDASLNGVDLTTHIVYGTNAAGETTFALNYYSPPVSYPFPAFIACSTPPSAPYTCWWAPDSMDAHVTIEPFSSIAPGDYHLNFINTFSVDIVAGDSDSALVSEGGRYTTLVGGGGGGTLPEPSTLLLMGGGLLIMFRLARKRQPR